MRCIYIQEFGTSFDVFSSPNFPSLPSSLPPLSPFLSPPPPSHSPPHTHTHSFHLQYLLCGLAEINVEDWRKYTVYANGYTPHDDVIIWFWKVGR